jgi:IclR family KDG regulon transcriptional repressor
LGPELVALSREVLNNLDYREVVTPFLASLAKNTHNTALFGLLNDENVFVVAKHEGEGDISVTIRLGHRFSITAGAHGKAIVAFMSEEERKKILKREKLFFHGDVAKLDRKRLSLEFDRCRESGFAFDMGELNPGINAVASPVFGAHGKLLGSIFVVGTFQREHVPVYGTMVAGKAKEVSRMLGADVEKLYTQAGSHLHDVDG